MSCCRALARIVCILAAGLPVLTGSVSARAESVPVDVGGYIVNGLATQAFPSTGALLYSQSSSPIDEDNASSWCSGTLIGCRTFLTAAHCVHDDTNAGRYFVYLQHSGIHAVSSIKVHPSYNPDHSARDVAVLTLADTVTGIEPARLNTTHDLEALGVGLSGTIVGFGRSGGVGAGSSDYGIKQYGAVITADCDTGETDGESNDRLVCWNYDSTIGPAGTDSNTCNGDSGGPLFMSFSGTTELVGVTSAGVSLYCTATDHSWDASVYYNRAWITTQLGADSTSTCGALAAAGGDGSTITSYSGMLTSAHPVDAYTVNVSGAPSLLRFTLNAHDTSFNPNIFVRRGLGASALLYDCKADGSSAVGACEFENPQSGTWSVLVQRASGGGRYQITATALDGTCGNGVIDSGEQCDGSDLGSCVAGPCEACACPAPVCGNDVVESGEDCDGTSDDECSGQCASDCSCPTVCTTGDLYGLSIVSDARKFSYKAQIFDPASDYDSLNPRMHELVLEVTDGSGNVALSIPALHPGWTKADPVARRYGWKGDGTLSGLRRVKVAYRVTPDGAFWQIGVRGKEVPGASSIDVSQVLDFRLELGGTCQLETW